MKIRWSAFNLYLLAFAFLLGCKSPQEKIDSAEARRQKKEMTALRVHLESGNSGPSRAQAVSILRASPMLIKVENDPILDERDLVSAAITDYMGGFAIQLQFDDHGSLVLDTTSTSHRGKRVAILCNFGEQRWLAAPVMSRRINDGSLTFTPDATREEAVRIVRGLNNTVAKLKRQDRFLPGW